MNCKNCENPLQTNDKFCKECGARVINQRLTAKYLGTEFRENFFSIDSNRPLRTFLDLFKKPEEVVDGYIKGVRKKYINPFGYFTLAVTFSSIFYFLCSKFFPDRLDAAYTIVNSDPNQAAMQNAIKQFTFEYQSLIFFLFIPLFTVITFILFFNKKKYNFTEHIVLNLYGYSQASFISITIFFISAISVDIFKYAMSFAMLIQIAYYSYLLKRVFSLNVTQLLLKILLFVVVGGFFYIAISIVVALALFIFGVVEIRDFIPKKEAIDGVSYIASSVINWTS